MHTSFLPRTVTGRPGLRKEEVLLGRTPCLATPGGGSLHGGEQRRGVVRDVVQVGTDIEAVNHVVGVPLPGHPEVGSRGARSLGSPLPRTQSACSLPPHAWESGPSPSDPHASPTLTPHLSVPYATNPPTKSTFRLLT